MTGKNKTKKFISGLLIISILLPTVLLSVPKQANATLPVYDYGNAVVNWLTESFNSITSSSTVVNTATTLKTWTKIIGEELLKAVAKQILAKMTQATINWINTDFHGAPLFLENPKSFFTDIAKSELKTVVDIFGYNSLLYPFGKDFALNAINSYKSQLATNAAYTLNSVMNSAQYRGNFNYGGWNAFLINTQYPQNNYIGFNMIATEELARRLRGTVQSAAQQQQTLLQQGMGFLSPQMCDPAVNPNYNNGTNEFQKPSFQYTVQMPATTADPMGPSEVDLAADKAATDKWTADKAAAQTKWAATNECKKKDGTSGLKNTTPGAVAGNQIMNAMTSGQRLTELQSALGGSISAILDALLSHFLDKGLNALAETINPPPSTDNWSYDGNPLGGNTDTAGALNIPQNVSVTVGQTSSTAISGGNGNYSIQPQLIASKAIAVASIDVSGSSGNKLTVTGVKTGTTTITVQDSSTPVKTVTVTITVNAIGALAIIPANISINVNTGSNNQIIATISGGTEPYSMQIGPNEEVAIAILSGTNLIVSGIALGSTYVEIKDSSTPAKTVHANITLIDSVPLTTSQKTILSYTGKTTNITIYGGKKPYVIDGAIEVINDVPVIVATILDNILTVTGKVEGETSVKFRDSSQYLRNVTIPITILAPLGICYIRTDFEIKDINQSQCTTNGGIQWIQNP